MRNVRKRFAVLVLAAGLPACTGNDDQQRNADVALEANSAAVDVATLPADESSATSSEDLAAGATAPTANETSNGY